MKKTFKISQFSRFPAEVQVCDSGQNLKMTKTSSFFSIHQENTCKSSLHLNLIILTDFHSFTVNEEKLQNQSIFQISPKVQVCDFDQNLKMTKTCYFCSIHLENTCKSNLNSNLIILTDFPRFTVKEDKLQD